MILSNGCVRIRFWEAGQGLVQSGRADQILARERPVFRPFVCLKAEAGVFADSDENFCKELLEFATHLYKMSISLAGELRVLSWPRRIADVFVLREMDRMDTAQICEAHRISQNNLWVMLHRARMALRECLELNWFERAPRLEAETNEQR